MPSNNPEFSPATYPGVTFGPMRTIKGSSPPKASAWAERRKPLAVAVAVVAALAMLVLVAGATDVTTETVGGAEAETQPRTGASPHPASASSRGSPDTIATPPAARSAAAQAPVPGRNEGQLEEHHYRLAGPLRVAESGTGTRTLPAGTVVVLMTQTGSHVMLGLGIDRPDDQRIVSARVAEWRKAVRGAT